MTLNITDAELHEWANMRADDAGRLARELVACRLQSQAAVAAAYEKAAQVCIERRQGWLAPYVRALATPDQIAALAADRAATVTVKPLVWEDIAPHHIAPHHSKAALPLFGSIRAESWGGDYSVVWSVPGMCDTFTHGKWATLDAAKAAAQADYDARIRAAITIASWASPATIPLPRAEVEALMEAAQLVSDWGEWALQIGGVCPDRLVGCLGKMRLSLATLQERMK